MDVNKIAAAEKFLYDMDMEWKNWKAAQANAGELLALVREASKEVGELEKTRERLKNEIAGLQSVWNTENAKLETAHKQKIKELADGVAAYVKDLEEHADRVMLAKVATENAEKAAGVAADRQRNAEMRLLEVEEKIEKANELRRKLTQV